MTMQELKAALNKAERELIADGWEKILSVMHNGTGIAYGTLYTKDGIRFYLNKDTVIPTMSGPQMAYCCKALFN